MKVVTLAFMLLSIGTANAESVTICSMAGCSQVEKTQQMPASYWKPLSTEEQARLSPPISMQPSGEQPKSQARVPMDPNGKSAKAMPPSAAKPIAKPGSDKLPPAEFDHAFIGEVRIVTVYSDAELIKACQTFTTVACAQTVNRVCVVHIRDNVERVVSRDIVMRHEVGHCNGWGKDHAGARTMPQEQIR
jgi:hypothetical protein